MEYIKMDELLHGADYNYEQWKDQSDILDQDSSYMKLTSSNVMTVGIFSWSSLEPTEGNYNFEWMDDLFDRLHKNGIKVILATPSGSKPVWLSETYPEVCRVDARGKRQAHGYRHNHCRTSPIFREKCNEINHLLAERYKDHPALIMWHVSNEYNGEACYCDNCISAFQNWLKERYLNLEALNNAWWTTFWSHNYSDWKQIKPYDKSIHGLMIDWQRFISDQTLDFFKNEIVSLRKITPEIPITTNFMVPNVGLNYWDFTPYIDVVSWDNYPKWHLEKEEWKEGARISFYHDYHRSLKNQPFMMMESTPSQVNWQEISIPKKPNMHLLSSLQAVAHGSDTVQYFQWRQSRGGEEKFHGSVISHSGQTETKVFKDVSEVGKALKSLKEIKGSTTKAEVAILYDFESEWAIDNALMSRNYEKCYQERCIAHYQSFWGMGISVDIKDCSHPDFSKYKIVIAPMLYMLRDNIAEKLNIFVSNGGILVMTYLTGLVNESDLCFLGGFPGPLRGLAGLWIEETDILNENNPQFLKANDDSVIKTGIEYPVKHYADIVHLESAKSEAEFGNGALKGSPAVTVNNFGNGKTYYLASRNSESFYKDFYKQLVENNNIQAAADIDLPKGVTIQVRQNKKSLFMFIMNFNNKKISITIPRENGEDMLTKEHISDIIKLSSYGIRIIKFPLA